MTGLAVDLARVATDAADGGRAGWSAVRDALARLGRLRDADLPEDLRGWGRRIAARDGALPLLGLGVRAATFPGLLWNGARLHRAHLGAVEGLTLVGLASAPPDADAADLLRGVVAGLAVNEALAGARGAGVPSTGVVGAAACAAVCSGMRAEDLPELLDLAGTLMVVAPATDDGPVERALRTGHELAAGWLAGRLTGTGILGMPDGLRDTVSTVTGEPCPVPAQRVRRCAEDPAPVGVRPAELLGSLS